MNDDEVLDGIRDLVAGSEYRDLIPGKAGVDLEGDDFELSEWPAGVFRRIYTRRTERYERAKANGWLDPLPPPAAPRPELVDRLKDYAHRTPPPLFRRLYSEIGNGGFGPSGGLEELGDWTHPASKDRSFAGTGRPRIGVRLVTWKNSWHGGAELDLYDGQVWGVAAGYTRVPTLVSRAFPTGLTLAEWLARWLDRPMHPPVLIEEGGGWRPGTEDEERDAWLAHLDWLRDPRKIDENGMDAADLWPG